MNNQNPYLLYAVTDHYWLDGRTLYSVVEESLKGGVTMVQLREKDMDYQSFKAEAREIRELCHKYQVPFIINDNVELAIETDADGVHVGQRDMEAGIVRKKLGTHKLLGVSAQTVEQALSAQKQGADYLGVGAVFPTNTKTDADAVSYDTLKAICNAVAIPVVAIGGITSENTDQLKNSNIQGIAVVSAIYGADNIREASGQLLKKVKSIVK